MLGSYKLAGERVWITYETATDFAGRQIMLPWRRQVRFLSFLLASDEDCCIIHKLACIHAQLALVWLSLLLCVRGSWALIGQCCNEGC